MTLPPDPEDAPLGVALGRSVAGILLIVLGAAILAGIVFLLFVTPFLDGDWTIVEYVSDFVWVPATIGLLVLLWGVNLVRRARKTRLEEPVASPESSTPTPTAPEA